MSNKTLNLTDALQDYLLGVSLRETPVMQRLREETSGMEMARMQIAPEQGQFMALLAQLIGARHCIEVGVFTGYSSLCVASALPADGRLIACDVSAEWTQVAQRYWQEAGVAQRIDLRLAPALETLAGLLSDGRQNSFDLAFIDADKTSYDGYYEHCLQLLRPGGLLLIDNVLWGGAVVHENSGDEDTRAIQALNRKIHTDQRVDICLVPIADGLFMVRKR